MAKYQKIMTLSNESINATVDEACKEYADLAGKRAENTAKIRLSFEELLLECQDTYGADADCKVILRKTISGIRFVVLHHGPQLNPLSKNEGYEDEGLSVNIMQRLGMGAYFYYMSIKNLNVLLIDAPIKAKKNKMLKDMILAVVLAVIAYFLLGLLPQTARDIIYTGLAEPVFNKLTGIISGIATVLVFFAVITGIVGCGDVGSLGKIGKKLFSEMGISYLFMWAVISVACCFVYRSSGVSSGGSADMVKQLVDLVLDIFPSNLVAPFVENNALQVITISVFVGFVLLLLSGKVENIRKFCFEASDIINKMMAIVCKTLPLVVFLGVYNMLASGSIKKISKIYMVFVLFAAICALFIVILTIRTRIIAKVPMKVVIKKMTEAFLITLTTSSQVAAIPANMHCFTNRFGIRKDLADFSLPLCVVTYMPCGAAFLGLTAIALGSLAGISLTPMVIVKAALVAVIVAIAAPPIPGSAFAVLPIIFEVCGVPDSQFPMAILLGTVIGYFLPAFNCYCLQLKILIVSCKMEMVDKEVLADPAKM